MHKVRAAFALAIALAVVVGVVACDGESTPAATTISTAPPPKRVGSQNYRVELIPGVDHNIVLCETGRLVERDRRSRAGWLKYAPEYLDGMEAWLVQLRGQTS